MRGKRMLAVAVVAAGTVVGQPAPADAATGHVVARWEMNEPPGATRMHDASGNGHDGRIGDEILAGTAVRDAVGYRFSRLEPNTPPPHPHHLVTVADSPDLNPGNRDYAITLRLRTTYHFGNVVQKGQATVSGGNVKVQIPNGIVQCFIRGSGGTIGVIADHAINDGAWHTVRCERTTDRVSLFVDGRLSARRNGRTGYIANDWPVSIGGKTACNQEAVSCDYFAGDLDRVQIDAG